MFYGVLVLFLPQLRIHARSGLSCAISRPMVWYGDWETPHILVLNRGRSVGWLRSHSHVFIPEVVLVVGLVVTVSMYTVLWSFVLKFKGGYNI